MIPFLFFVYSILEGDNLKDIIIEILGFGFCHEANITIWNSNQELVYVGKTFFGKIKVALKAKSIYLLSVCSVRGNLQIPFYVDCKRKYYYFGYPVERFITFQLMDANYLNLPIEKGEIIVE